jgi:hypothetical protein
MGSRPAGGYAGRQVAGKGVAINAGKDLRIACSFPQLFIAGRRMMADVEPDKYSDQTQQFTQSLEVDGKVVSSRSDKVGKGARFNTAVEGQGKFSGVIHSHSKFRICTKGLVADLSSL